MENSVLNSIISKDKDFLIYLNNLGSEQWDGFWLLVTNKYTFVALYLALIVFFYVKKTPKKATLLLLLGVLLVASSDQLANLFKYGFKRLRPCHEAGVQDVIRLVKASCGGKFSYFSAHASTNMALAVFFGLIYKNSYPKLIYFLLIIAFFVGYSRIYIGVHYPLDVFSGFLIGTGLALFFYKIFRFFVAKRMV